MTNRADIWAGNTNPEPFVGNVEARAMDTARTIDQRPSMVVITRRDPKTQKPYQLPPQRVRIEIQQNIRSANERSNMMMSATEQYVVMMGYADHPIFPDFDVVRADTFFYQERLYTVVEILDTLPGRRMASCKLGTGN